MATEITRDRWAHERPPFPRLHAAIEAGADDPALSRALALDRAFFFIRAYRAARLAGGIRFWENRNLIHVSVPEARRRATASRA